MFHGSWARAAAATARTASPADSVEGCTPAPALPNPPPSRLPPRRQPHPPHPRPRAQPGHGRQRPRGRLRDQSGDQHIPRRGQDHRGDSPLIQGRDKGRIWRVAEALEYGIVGINEGIISTEEMPFGGVEESGIDQEGAELLSYLAAKFDKGRHDCYRPSTPATCTTNA